MGYGMMAVGAGGVGGMGVALLAPLAFSCWMGLGKKRTAFTILRARQGLLRGTCTKLHAK